MNDNFKSTLEKRLKQLYGAVKNQRPDLYDRVVQVAHLATVEFGGADELKRAAFVEAAVMGLVADAAGITREVT